MAFSGFPEQCPLCQSATVLLNRNHPGYQQPVQFSIYACTNCNTQFASPLYVDDQIYDIIYKSARSIRGYSRYVHHANLVLSKPDPLGFLARAGEPYWFICNYLETQNVPKNAKVLEVGSGLGYLTYAIHKRGYDSATGMDVSANAVENARRRYGDLYIAADLTRYSETTQDRYDIIVITEVVEHVVNIFEMIRSMKAILKDNGAILLTTPNKSMHAMNSYWRTENPPVHLWWLSENSMRQIAIHEKLQIQFWDFSEFHHYRVFGVRKRAAQKTVPILPPYISSEGAVLSHPHFVPPARPINEAMEKLFGERAIWLLKRTLQIPARSLKFYRDRGRWSAARSDTMGVVLKHP